MVLVSVIIPTYNRIKYLFRAVDSVVNQTFKDFEIIIINDCSTQREYNLLEFPEPNITVIHLPKNLREVNNSPHCQGLTRNIGIEKAQGKYIAFLDDDDWWHPDKLKTQIELMERHNLKMSCTNAFFHTKETKRLYFDKPIKNILTLNDIIPENLIMNSSVVILASLVKEHKFRQIIYEDYDLWKRILKDNVCLYIKEPFLNYDGDHGDGVHYHDVNSNFLKIKVFSNYCSDSEILNAYKKVFLNGVNTYKNLKFVDDDSYTHAIILNTVMPTLKIPKENVIGLSYEPLPFLGLTDKFLEYAKKFISEYRLSFSNLNLPKNFVSKYSFMTHKQERQNYLNNILPEKKGKMAIWCSYKTYSSGHKYRHSLIEKILELKLPIDIWGNGCERYKGDNVKGKFEDEPYKNYEYCISIENYETDDYISEKLLDCLCFNTIPVYLGARNVDKYFGDCCIKLTENIDKDIEIIKAIIQNSPKKDLSFARKQLFEGDCYLPEYLHKIFNL